MSSSPDLEQVLAVLARDPHDEAAWTTLYRQMWGFVIAIVYRRIGGNCGVAQDISQNVFVRLAQHCPFPKLQTSETFRAYVWRVAENECNRYFARKRLPEGLAEPTALRDQSAADPSDIVEVEEIHELITAVLAEDDRMIVVLTSEGHSAEQIAAKLQISQSNVSVRLHRARKRLRIFLKNIGLYN